MNRPMIDVTTQSNGRNCHVKRFERNVMMLIPVSLVPSLTANAGTVQIVPIIAIIRIAHTITFNAFMFIYPFTFRSRKCEVFLY